ncbi:MAG: signal recognition particle subunit SRP19/SEC65 family protein [Methanomicrobiales archaeon]|nr:signal recognition particle subunit SRP19/SEC65 family protein [Methanomicrobiales archaeon]
MENARKGELIVYPCYFEAGLVRAKGRRVPVALAVHSPTLSDIEKALKRLKIEYRVDAKHHPAHWEKKGGRLVVLFSGRKTELIRKIAAAMERKR